MIAARFAAYSFWRSDDPRPVPQGARDGAIPASSGRLMGDSGSGRVRVPRTRATRTVVRSSLRSRSQRPGYRTTSGRSSYLPLIATRGHQLAFVAVTRFLPALAFFLAGAAFSWWVSHPAAVVTASRELPSAHERDWDRAIVVDLTDHVAEPPVGIPPNTATVPKSHPGAGQKRALTRAVDALTKSPPSIDNEADNEAPADEDVRAAVGAALRAAILDQTKQGDTP